jgi:hypothetical protein
MSSVTQMVFFEPPRVLYVDLDSHTQLPPHNTIDELMRSLQEHGPLVATGIMGPNAYTESPFQLEDKVGGKRIYAWNPGKFKWNANFIEVILLGASKTEPQDRVYFTLARGLIKDISLLVQQRAFSLQVDGFIPSSTDTKVYAMSYQNFLGRSLGSIYPIFPHAERLFSMPVQSILSNPKTRRDCGEIGQKIFDHYKTASNTDEAISAVQRICEAAKFLSTDGVVRSWNINDAWDGIGDRNWVWEK